jgi:hypothetical protein
MGGSVDVLVLADGGERHGDVDTSEEVERRS